MGLIDCRYNGTLNCFHFSHNDCSITHLWYRSIKMFPGTEICVHFDLCKSISEKGIQTFENTEKILKINRLELSQFMLAKGKCKFSHAPDWTQSCFQINCLNPIWSQRTRKCKTTKTTDMSKQYIKLMPFERCTLGKRSNRSLGNFNILGQINNIQKIPLFF